MPVEVLCAASPLPGVRLCSPRHIHMVQLEVAVTGIPCTLSVGEVIAFPFDWWWLMHCFPRDTDRLVNVDHVGVRDMVIRSQPLQLDMVVSSYLSQRIAAHHNVDAVSTRTQGLRRCPKYVCAHDVRQQEQSEYQHHTYMSNHHPCHPVLLKIVPDSLM